MTDGLDELFGKIADIYREYYPKEKICIGEIATEFIKFGREFTVVAKKEASD